MLHTSLATSRDVTGPIVNGRWQIDIVVEYLYRAFMYCGINPAYHCISMTYPSWCTMADRTTLVEWFMEVCSSQMTISIMSRHQC